MLHTLKRAGILLISAIAAFSLFSCAVQSPTGTLDTAPQSTGETFPVSTEKNTEEKPSYTLPETPTLPKTEPLPETETPPETEASPIPDPVLPQYMNPLTGLACDPLLVGKRPVMIVFNNLKISLPQSALSACDIVYEVLAEGSMQYAEKVSINLSDPSKATARADLTLDFSEYLD